MNKLLLLIASLFYILPVHSQSFKLIDDNQNQIIAEHHLKPVDLAFSKIEGDDYVNFSKSHTITTLQKGFPQIPTFSSSFIVPNTGKTELIVEFDSYYEITDVKVAPSKGNLKRNVDPASVPYEFNAVYNQDAFYPGNLAVASEPFILRESRGVTVIFYPYQYNPVTQKIRVYENLRVRVVTNKSQTGTNEIVQKSKNGNQTQGIFNRYFLNGQNIAKYTPKSEQGEMLIICGEGLEEAIAPLARWKNQKGIKTTVVSTEITGTTEESIKTYIQNAYAENGNLLYLLLVGDNDKIPAYSYGQSGGEELFSDTYYGQLTGSDYYPELFVGRFSGTATNVANMVERTITYEKYPAAGNWMTKAIGLGSDEGDGFGDDGEADWQHLRNIRTELLDFGYTNIYEFYDGSRGGQDANGNPNSSIILPAINEGVGLFNYTGHGDLNICVSGNFTSNHINTSTNHGKYPFVVSVACNNGTFIYGTCISETWLRARKNDAPTGAIAACGSSILMAWAQPMQTQDELAALISESNASNKKTTLGGLFYNAQLSMLEEYPGIDGHEVMQTWVFFGDPSVEFRNKETLELAASHVPQVPENTASLSVSCNVEDAQISVSQNDIFLGKGKISGGTVTINFPALNNDFPLLVTATKQNYNVYQGNVQVGNGPLGIKDLEISDLKVYPNPAESELFIEFTTEEHSTINLMDLTGKIIRTMQTESGIVKVNMQTEGIAGGIYQLQIESGKQTSFSKVILK